MQITLDFGSPNSSIDINPGQVAGVIEGALLGAKLVKADATLKVFVHEDEGFDMDDVLDTCACFLNADGERFPGPIVNPAAAMTPA